MNSIEITVPDEWEVVSHMDGFLMEPGDTFVVEHPNGLLGTIEVEDGEYDATDVFATLVDETQSDGDDALESLWLSDADFDGETEVARDEVIDEFEHWLTQYQDWE